MKVLIDPQVEKFIVSAEQDTRAKITRTINLLKVFGSKLHFPHSKKITKELFELRIHGQQEVRILYAFIDSAAFLLLAFMKKQDKIPKKFLETAWTKFSLLT